jgi:TPR repeat protein
LVLYYEKEQKYDKALKLLKRIKKTKDEETKELLHALRTTRHPVSMNYKETIKMLEERKINEKTCNKIKELFKYREQLRKDEYYIMMIRENDEINVKIGKYYEEGKGTEKDEKEAFKLYEEIYEHNAGSKMRFEYLRCIYEGIGTPKNENKALHKWITEMPHYDDEVRDWLEERANRGNKKAQNILLRVYIRSWGQKYAYEHAEKYAKQGNNTAKLLLVLYNEHGLGIKKNEERAYEMCKKICDMPQIGIRDKITKDTNSLFVDDSDDDSDSESENEDDIDKYEDIDEKTLYDIANEMLTNYLNTYELGRNKNFLNIMDYMPEEVMRKYLY